MYKVYVNKKVIVETTNVEIAKLAFAYLKVKYNWVLLNHKWDTYEYSLDATPAVMKGEDTNE
jgi:hypothetical protein